MDKLPAYLRKPIFEKLFNISEYTKLSEEEKEMYDVALKREWDHYSLITTAENEGLKRGREEGRTESKIQFVLKAHKESIPLETIATLTDMSVQGVKDIIKNNQAAG